MKARAYIAARSIRLDLGTFSLSIGIFRLEDRKDIKYLKAFEFTLKGLSF